MGKILFFLLFLGAVCVASYKALGLTVAEWIQKMKLSPENPFVIWAAKKIEESRRQ